jgi:hypothetical protein
MLFGNLKNKKNLKSFLRDHSRVCSVCKEEKSLSDFSIHKSEKSWCIGCKCSLCVKRYSIEYRMKCLKNPPTTVSHKTCNTCGEKKEACEFSPSKYSKTGLASYCKPCRRIYIKKRKEEQKKNSL